VNGSQAPAERVVAAGADGCRGGWVVAARLDGGAIDVGVVPSFATILSRVAEAPLAIDIPIGLPEAGPRASDLLARARLGPRRSSVFPAPVRPMLSARTHADACAIGRRIGGKGISIEAWNIVAKVAEVDALMTPALQARVLEAHPELCFTMMNDGVPASFSKKTELGRQERKRLLARRLPAAEPALAAGPLRGAAADDLLDALATLWTAERYRCGGAEALTEAGATDARGLRMEIWF
jgi:predicted RNase H-like nuclease